MSEHRANETVPETHGTEREATSEAAERAPVAEAAEQVVTAAADLGRLWARHGLSIGRLALETSAEALKTTAGLLQAVESAFAPPKKAES